jgi:hypothetical protein
MLKMASHEPFRHLQHKLWSKEGPGVKLAVWLPTTKSRESTRHRCVQMECDHWKALGESYKFALDLIPIRGLNWELWAPKVLGVQTGIISRLLLESPGTKSHSNASATEQRREYYMGEGNGFPRIRAVVSQVSPCCPWFVPTPKVIPNVN